MKATLANVISLLLVCGCSASRPSGSQTVPVVITPAPPIAPIEQPMVATSDHPALILTGNQTITLESGTHRFDRICVQDQARIATNGPVTLVLMSPQTTVIGGRGIGPQEMEPASITIEAQETPELFVLFDNEHAPIAATLNAPQSTGHIGLTGRTGLEISGELASSHSYAQWGLPDTFPACDAQMDREPDAAYPPSRPNPDNCGSGGYTSSNFTLPMPAGQRRELHIVGVYEAQPRDVGTVEVRVERTAAPVVLVLSAYRPTRWQLQLAPGATVAAVYTSGYDDYPQTVSGLSANVPVHRLPYLGSRYRWESDDDAQNGARFNAFLRRVRAETGLRETSFQGCYSGVRFTVPFARNP